MVGLDTDHFQSTCKGNLMVSEPTHTVASTRVIRSDFWKFWTGQTISSLGSSFTGFALPLLVFKLTNSPVNLALTVATAVLPYLLFGLTIGVFVDRVNRKRLMIGADIGRACIIASLPLLASLGLLSVWWVYGTALLSSTLSMGFDAANFAAIPSLVKQEKLVTANGRIQASYATASIAGPLLAGLLLVILPMTTLFLFDALSFLISAGSLALVITSFNTQTSAKKERTTIRQDVLKGLHLIAHNAVLRWLTMVLLLLNLVIPTISVQFVLFAKSWLHATDAQVGILFACGSAGVVIASLLATQLRKHLSFGIMIIGTIALEGVLTVVLPLTHEYWLTLFFWTLRSGIDVLTLINAYSLTQSIVSRELLGRVITFIRVLTWPTAAIGALIGGFAIERTNIGVVYGVVGLLIVLTALAFSSTPLRYAERYIPKQEQDTE